MLTDAADIFLANAIKVCFVSALAIAVLNYERTPDYGKPVNLYLAAPTEKACGQDWLCMLEREHIIKKAKGIKS